MSWQRSFWFRVPLTLTGRHKRDKVGHGKVTINSARIIHFILRGWFRKFCHRCYNFVNIHDRLLYYTLIERAPFLLYNDAKTMQERNKYFEIHALKDTWGKTTGTFS